MMRMVQSPEETLLELLREERGDPTLSLEAALKDPLAEVLLKTLRRGMGSTLSAPDAETVVPVTLASFAQSTAILQAALQETFDIGLLEISPTERTLLADASDVVMLQGARVLRLNDVRRAEILNAVHGEPIFERVMNQLIAEDKSYLESVGRDPSRLQSAWLRRFLKGERGNLADAPVDELKAAHSARGSLRFVTWIPDGLPDASEISSRLGLGELLEPLRLLVGAQGGWDGTPRSDRFIGRREELRRLRAFVDELDSEGAFESLGRVFDRAKRTFGLHSRPWLISVEAAGGLGKSTLLAKFVLDHALGQKRPFPFAYLDFDRAVLDPERPPQMLIEIASQIALQFPAARTALGELIERIRAGFSRSETSSKLEAGIANPFAGFVEILNGPIFAGTNVLLLVLDTLETVQGNVLALKGIRELLSEFREKGLEKLCVVLSGRAEMEEGPLGPMEGLAEPIRLKALTIGEAVKMAEALGTRALGRTRWKPQWSSAIAGTESGSEAQREPLAVRVAVDLITSVEAETRDTLAEEIVSLGVEAHHDFAARLYHKRIVNHVRDERARKLAWPGLVLRSLTPEIARAFLAKLCKLDDTDVPAAFEALSREVWMVTKEGDVLKHRRELRAKTLPLMKKYDPKRFNEVAYAAVEYFRDRRLSSPQDRAEWIYHRLLTGEDPRLMTEDIDSESLRLLADASEDFRKGTNTESYLLSRTARRRLVSESLKQLLPEDVLYHLSRTAQNSFGFDEIAIDRAVLDVATNLDRFGFSGTTSATPAERWARTLWIKTGCWQGVPGLDPRTAMRSGLTRLQLMVHLFWAARVALLLPPEDQQELLSSCMECIPVNEAKIDPIGFRSTVQVMALARMLRSPHFSMLDRRVANILRKMKPDSSASVQAAIRTIVVLGETSREPAIMQWLGSRRRGSGGRVRNATVSLTEVRTLVQLNPGASELLASTVEEHRDYPTCLADETTVISVQRAIEDMLDRKQEPSEPDGSLWILSRVFAVRNEDWIVPLGYASALAYQANLSPELVRYLSSFVPVQRNARPFMDSTYGMDMLAAMRRADESAALPRFARRVLELSERNLEHTANLAFLLRCRDAWEDGVARVLGEAQEISLTETGNPLSDAPEPGPILDPEDPQKGRWGGQTERAGRAVRIILESVERNLFYFSVLVESVDGSDLQGPVIFHLHSSYPRSVVSVRRIMERRSATLSEWSASGVFAIGVQVRTAWGEWTSLEVDLAYVSSLPRRFLSR